ncbi:hypothetical protein QBC46DRAFT_340461 [Diplogelasinospora grovesii]|uniref:SAM and PH domain-containing protein n=1 Tax=Diplogelasinospora grovesii TaxID=303347 RepID=A0AAN6N989_9PEZI|nr:hypothetical protein QBC46DRAFT_340461 [Diplogelasinospora grovesii]
MAAVEEEEEEEVGNRRPTLTLRAWVLLGKGGDRASEESPLTVDGWGLIGSRPSLLPLFVPLQKNHVQFTARERPHREMLEKSRMPESFFTLSNVKQQQQQQRPISVHTEFMESDWEMEEDEEDDDDHSEIEDLDPIEDGEQSPRISVGSSGGQPSFTTLSSYDEIQTPRSVRQRAAFPFGPEPKLVEGPKGPHLFRSSLSSTHSIEFAHALSLSPITPKEPRHMDYHLQATRSIHLTPLPTRRRESGPFQYTDEELDTATLANWSPEMVAQWMLNAGVELAATERFVENDINGAILITLKFEDLKELGIPSFGVRTRIWEEIHSMRNIRQPEPQPETPIEDEPDREVRRELRRQDSVDSRPKRQPSKPRVKINDEILPMESVSIVGIEQMMPKPHHCKKGENCPKWKRNQRMIEAFKKDHPFVNVEEGGIIMVAGDPGNPNTAEALRPADDIFRPVSDAMPSVVASSDVMGPGDVPSFQYLKEATLRSIQQRDPQDNVRQFLDFQHTQVQASSEIPPTPPFEIFPQNAHQQPPQNLQAGLRTLPKLAIPSSQTPPVPRREPSSAHPVIPSYREMSPSSSEDATPTAPYRFGTPFSDMDVPVTVQPMGPVARDISQSVPPDMNYRHQQAPPRSLSRATIRRPSFPVMPALDENSIVTPVTQVPSRSFSQRVGAGQCRPLQPPPRGQYPWTQLDRTTFERAIAPMPGSAVAANGVASVNIGGRLSPISGKPKEDMTDGHAISYQGLMKKRKTKMLRHEWHEHYFTLRGTRLAMHKDATTAANKTLEYIDIDDYAIACSSIASSKLNAAFKAMHIRRGSSDDNNNNNNKGGGVGGGSSKKDDVAAFSFQLIPQDNKGGVRLRKRESSVVAVGPTVPGPRDAVNGTGKTHHFAVKSRDDRIDWMRELMLAKALKQKGEGFEVSVNGNMI